MNRTTKQKQEFRALRLYRNGVLQEPPRYVFYGEKMGLQRPPMPTEGKPIEHPSPIKPHMHEYYRAFGRVTPYGISNPLLGLPTASNRFQPIPTPSNRFQGV